MTLQITTSDEIHLDGNPTGLRVNQAKDGTVVYWPEGGGVAYREINMPSRRYQLGSDSPITKPGVATRSAFEHDVRAIVSLRRSAGRVGEVFSDYGNGPPLFEPLWANSQRYCLIDAYACLHASSQSASAPGRLIGEKDGRITAASGIFAGLAGQVFPDYVAALEAAADLAEQAGLIVLRTNANSTRIRIR